MLQDWACESCGISGETELQKHVDVFGAIHKLNEAHDRKSPGCMSRTLRIRNVEICSARDWTDLTEQAKLKALAGRFIVDELPGKSNK